MKILEITNYTKGGCGVGMRVLKESKLLSKKGHEVVIFSTNREKGSEKLCSPDEEVDGFKIKRFAAVKLGGESYMKWNFKKEALKLKPDIIIAHAYRHSHTSQAIKIAKTLNCKVFLVTHAPFERKGSRSKIENILVNLYDKFIGKKELNKFTKIITITRWEEPYLNKLGVKKENITYIPNGIEESFFKNIKKIKLKPKNIIYTGRISPIKNLEVVNKAIAVLDDFNFKIMGPADNSYLNHLKMQISSLSLSKKVSIIPEKYDHKKQISELDKYEIFILPSKSEGMPQTLIEAMARGRIVVGSDNKGNKELIKNGENGFLFSLGDEKNLIRVLQKIKNLDEKEIRIIQSNARKTAERFKWVKIIELLEKTISS